MARVSGNTKENINAVNKNQPKKSANSDKDVRGGILFTLLAFLTAMAVMVIVFAGAFFILIRNNVNGLGEKYRDTLKNIPVVRLALPKPPDPDDPRYLSEKELKEKYNQYRELVKQLEQQLEEANDTIGELQKYKEREEQMIAEGEQLKKELEDEKARLEEDKKQLEEDRNKFSQLAAQENKAGFREFFEKTDKETAQKIYADIIKEEKISEEIKQFVQKYEIMDPSSAASIFEELSKRNMDLVVEILKNMKKDASAAIMEEMSPATAAQVTERLSKHYMQDDSGSEN